jgi:uncharacterized membrane protein YqiK
VKRLASALAELEEQELCAEGLQAQAQAVAAEAAESLQEQQELFQQCAAGVERVREVCVYVLRAWGEGLCGSERLGCTMHAS